LCILQHKQPYHGYANPNFEQTPAKYLKTLSIIHFALVAGQMLFAIVALVQSKKIMINVREPPRPAYFYRTADCRRRFYCQ
jgi:hypothetical protein